MSVGNSVESFENSHTQTKIACLLLWGGSAQNESSGLVLLLVHSVTSYVIYVPPHCGC